jgi:CDP-Glycerol:Poly(glycerophosphate) glycerophosphotransferase
MTPDRPLWLVLPDPLSARIFFDCRIVERLHERLGDRLEVVFLMEREEAVEWEPRLRGQAVTHRDELFPDVRGLERVRRRVDRCLDARIGFYPLAIRVNLRHGFHRERMQPGHQNWFLDPTRVGPLPRWVIVERAMLRWHFSRLRYVPHALRERLRRERPALLISNIQMQVDVPMIVAARDAGLPLVGYVASWDHTVGKGVMWPGMSRYLVQNDVMRGDLARYHGIAPERVAVTGWPQTDVFHRRRPRDDYDALLRGFGLDPARPLVLVMGNTPTNAPYEERFVERLVSWWEAGPRERFQLLFRPHPRDRLWRERFAAALDRPGAHVQEPSYTDLETLATLLQHGDCVVANAGTILLDSLVNDRPAVCVLYDEGAPPGESWAAKNVTGEHYRQLIESQAFYRARAFEEVAAGIERALDQPAELAAERRRVSREVVGEVDGRAAERVVDEALSAVGGSPLRPVESSG